MVASVWIDTVSCFPVPCFVPFLLPVFSYPFIRLISPVVPLSSYSHSWESVTSAFWRKYPNSFQPYIQEVDTYNRHIDADGNLVVDRIVCNKTKNVPGFVKSVGISDTMYGLERTTIDPQKKSMIVKSMNIGGSSVMTVAETCIYRQNKEDPTKTQYTQNATLTAFVPFVSGKIEAYTLSRFNMNAPKGLSAMEDLCKRVSDEGISILTDPLEQVKAAFDTAIEDTQAEFHHIINTITPATTAPASE